MATCETPGTSCLLVSNRFSRCMLTGASQGILQLHFQFKKVCDRPDAGSVSGHKPAANMLQIYYRK